MTIHTYDEPDGAATVVITTLHKLGLVGSEPPAGGYRGLDLDAAGSDRPEIGEYVCPPFVIRTMSGDALNEENCFEHAAVTGWRYLLPRVHVTVDYQLSDKQAGNITTGPLLDSLTSAAELAEQSFAENPDDFRVGILEVPALQVAALTIEGPNNVYFIAYKDPRPGNDIKIEDPELFSGRLAEILRQLNRNYSPRQSPVA